MKRSQRRGLGLVAVAAIAGATLPTMPTALAAPSTTVSGFSVATSQGSAVTDPAVAPTVGFLDGDALTLNGKTAAGADLQISIVHGAGVSLTAGAQLPLVSSGADNGLYVTFNGAVTACALGSGTAEVLEVQRDPATNDLTAVALDWSGTCHASVGGTTSGQLRWNATAGYSGFDAPNAGFEFPQSYIGDPGSTKVFTWTARGTEPVTALPASIVTTESPASFLITKDDCKSAGALAPGQSCSVTVQVSPRSPYPPQARLVLGDPSAAPTSGYAMLSVVGKYGAKGTFNPLPPKRTLDTRVGLGAPKALVGPGKSIKLTVLGRGGVPPTAVSAVSLNLTLVGTTSSTYVTAYPSGTTRPTASSINAPAGFTGANSITVRPGSDGTITLYNASGSTHMLADVTGYYTLTQGARAPGGDFHLVAPERILDTRYDGGGQLYGGYWIDQGLDYDPVLGQVRAYALNVTVTRATSNGYITVWSGADTQDPTTFSTVNYTKGSTRTNTVVTPALWTTRDGYYGPGFGVFNGGATGAADVIVDVAGIYTTQGGADALRFTPLPSPKRILDSRYGLGASKWTAGSTRTINAPGDVAGYDTWALLGNAVLVKPSTSTWMTFWAAGTPRPTTSNLNAPTGATVANGAVIPMGASNDFNGYNSVGTVDAIYDVTGSFELFPASPSTVSGARVAAGSRVSSPSTADERSSLPEATQKLTREAAPAR